MHRSNAQHTFLNRQPYTNPQLPFFLLPCGLISQHLLLQRLVNALLPSVLNKSNKSNLAFGFDLNLIREVEI
jgi:hypothetical protein